MARRTDLDISLAQTGLAASIPITASATTSRVVLDNPAVRVVLFAFDDGELLTDHSSPRAVVVHLIDGSIRFTVDNEEHALVPGDVLYLAPGATHSLVADAPSHLSLVMVDVAATAASATS